MICIPYLYLILVYPLKRTKYNRYKRKLKIEYKLNSFRKESKQCIYSIVWYKINITEYIISQTNTLESKF